MICNDNYECRDCSCLSAPKLLAGFNSVNVLCECRELILAFTVEAQLEAHKLIFIKPFPPKDYTERREKTKC